jgi:hypothetical protein
MMFHFLIAQSTDNCQQILVSNRIVSHQFSNLTKNIPKFAYIYSNLLIVMLCNEFFNGDGARHGTFTSEQSSAHAECISGN